MNRRRKFFWRTAGVLALAAAGAGAAFFACARKHAGAPLPYHDSFASNSASEWQAFGGVWQLSGGTLMNRSDERGAKLVTGSPQWTDYKMQADLEMIGNEGELGVIVRGGQLERGIDSYDGYYVGLRRFDSALIIGRADHGWMEGRPVPIPGGMHASVWYRLTVVAVGCRIAAQATNIQTGQTEWGAFEDDHCVRAGKIGLRSMGTGGAWKNISVVPATENDWLAIRSHAAYIQHPDFPILEADYNRIVQDNLAQTNTAAQTYDSSSLLLPDSGAKKMGAIPEPPLVSIEDLRSSNWPGRTMRIRGVVTLTDPLYVQDSMGGIAVETEQPISLNLGDEIELTGTQISSGYSTKFMASAVRLLWDRTLVAPLSISTTQAASGAFNSSLVEVRGYLRAKSKDANGAITLNIGDEAQSFTVILTNSLFEDAYHDWQLGSWLRVQGVCVIDASFVPRHSSFMILTRSPEDVEILAGPPWWSGERILWVIFSGLMLILLGIVLFLRIEHWKMRGILSERERLAHEMHDTLAQSFAGVGFHLQGIRNLIRSGKEARAPEVMGKLDTACDLVTQTHREASASIAALHPDADGGLDLLVALEQYASHLFNIDDLPIAASREGTPHRLSFPVRDTLFQIGREAISNVIRHSRASRIVLRLIYESKAVVLEIGDDGVGFLPGAGSGFGIKTMRSRASAIGAELTVTSAPGRGTTIAVRSPYGLRSTIADWLRYSQNGRKSAKSRIHFAQSGGGTEKR